MKKKKKQTNQRLNTLLLLLLLTAVLLVMSTYAWFTANRTVNIDSIDVKVTTSNGLQISADGITWKTVLEQDDLANAYNTYPAVVNQLPETMAPVSTALELNAEGRLKMFYGDVSADLDDPDSPTYGEYIIKGRELTDIASNTVKSDGEFDKGYYVAFDMFLKSGADAPDLYMSGSVVELQDSGGDLKPVEDPTYEKGIANAGRVALIKGEHTASEETDTIQGLATTAGKVMMWEPNRDYHTARAVENAKSLEWDTGLTNGANNALVAYDGIKAAFTNGILLKDGTATANAEYFKSVTPTWDTLKTGTPNMKMPADAQSNGKDLERGVTKYRVYLWVEGQDVDCENFASGSNIEYNLSFSLDPYAG